MFWRRAWFAVLLPLVVPVPAHGDSGVLTYHVQAGSDGRWEIELQSKVAEQRCLDDKGVRAIKLVTNAGREFTVQCVGGGMSRVIAQDLLAGAKLSLGVEPSTSTQQAASAQASRPQLQKATIYVQEAKGGAWRQDGSRSYTSREHLLGRAQDRCSTRSTDKLPERAAVKVVFTSGEEEVIDCVALWQGKTASPADSFDGARFIDGGCANNLALGHLVDCQCAAEKLRAMPPEPEVLKAGEKDAVRRAAEACPSDKPGMEQKMFEQCHSFMTSQFQNADEVCRCVAADTAAKYIAEPGFDLRHVERLRGAAIRSCGTRVGSARR